jgi:hypothetical protein
MSTDYCIHDWSCEQTTFDKDWVRYGLFSATNPKGAKIIETRKVCRHCGELGVPVPNQSMPNPFCRIQAVEE